MDDRTGPDSVRNTVSHLVGNLVQAGRIDSVTIQAPEPAPRPTPWQVPAPSAGLVDRAEPMAMVRGMAGRRDGPRPAVVTIHGLPGIGKTTLLRHAAASVREFFPDGALHADLGPSRYQGPNTVSDVLARMLAALGVPDRFVPTDLPRRVDMYRSLTVDLRLLVVLDDVADAAQVNQLLPNSATAMVLAASRRNLEELLLDGAIAVELRELEPADAVAVLADTCPDGRLDPDSPAAHELAALCGFLPLALRTAGARLAARRSLTVDRLVTELRDAAGALDGLSLGGNRVVEAVFDVVCHDIPERTGWVYRCLGMLTGSHVPDEAVAALCGLPLPATRRALDDLRRLSLIDELPDGTITMHRLVRLHALRWSERVDTDATRTGALRSALDWWLRGAVVADIDATGSRRLRVIDVAAILGDDPPPAPPEGGLDWLERQHANLLGLLRAAADHEWQDDVWRLFETLFALYDRRKPLAAWLEAGGLAVTAATRSGNRAAEIRVRCLFALGLRESHRYAEAGEQLAIARELATALGDARLLASTMDFTGGLHMRLGEYQAALECFEYALAVNERLDLPRAVALQSRLAAGALGKLGRVEDALAMLDQACAGFASLPGEEGMLVRAMLTKAEVLFDAARYAEAVVVLEDVLTRARRDGLRPVVADALVLSARIAERFDNADAVRELRDQAIAEYATMGSPRAAQLLVGR